ncbi:MAG: sugar efflux transporter [Anaerolineales bacterium]
MNLNADLGKEKLKLYSQSPHENSILNPLLLWFMLAMVLANVGGNMYGPLLPLYLTSLKANVIQVGLFFTLSQVIPLGLQILGGWISDTLGRLRSIALGSIAGVISYVVLILSPTWQWVLLGEGLGAITRSLVAPSFGAFIAEQSSEQNRAKVFGITNTIFMVVSVIGPPLGGLLAQRFGFRLMLLAAALLYLLATIIRVIMARYAMRNGEKASQALTIQSLKANMGVMFSMLLAGGLVTWILLTDGVRDIGYALSMNLLPIYLQTEGGLNLEQIGGLEAVFGVFMMLITFPAGWLADKWGERKVIAGGFLMQFTALLVFIEAKGFSGFALAWAIFGMGVGLMAPAYDALVSKAFPEKMRGIGFGLFQTSLGLISLPAPAIGAQLYDKYGPRFPFRLTAYLTLLTIIPVWLKFKLPKEAIESQEKIDS